MTVLKRLLRSLHAAVFDKAPGAELAFRLRDEYGLTWAVADDVLTVITAAPEPVSLELWDGSLLELSDGSLFSAEPAELIDYVGTVVPNDDPDLLVLAYDLTAFTMGELVAALQNDGFLVSGVSPAFMGLGAVVLAEGAGNQTQSNGDQVKGFTSLTWSLMTAFAREIREAAAQVREALKQMVITTAEGEWLDLWGTLYNVLRRTGETDAAYAPRIPQEAFRIRVNALAIEKAIRDATGKDVRIEEPWGSIFRLDESALSGTSRFYDGAGVGYHLLRPVSYATIDWSDVLPVIERNRAAGVVVLQPETRLRTWVSAPVDGTVFTGHSAYYYQQVHAWDANRLSAMVLSGEVIARSYQAYTEERTGAHDLSDYPAEIYSATREMNGYTWNEMGAWLDFPWSVDEATITALFGSLEAFHAYVNTTLPEDLS